MVQEIGETRQAMARSLTEKLMKISSDAHTDRGLDEFWIILSHREDIFLCNVIREAVVVTNKKPEHGLLNSMCFHVVWSRGIIEPVWILPRDIPTDIEVFGSDGNSEFVHENLCSFGVNILN